jgi:hypothetical protein
MWTGAARFRWRRPMTIKDAHDRICADCCATLAAAGVLVKGDTG